MADIFISYKREDLAQVQPLVTALRSRGLDVWWDQDIAPDAPWEATIEIELATSKAAIVAWSSAAITSENVKAEARQARAKRKLIQIFIQRCSPPLFFGERQWVDLSKWNGDADEHCFRRVLAAVQDATGIACLPTADPVPVESPQPSVRPDSVAAAAFADRGRIRLEDEDYDEALADFGEAARRDASFSDKLKSEIVEALTGRGRGNLEFGDFDEALDDFEEAVRCDPEAEKEISPDILEALLGRGRESLEQEEFDDAFASFARAVRINPAIEVRLKGEIAEAFRQRMQSYLSVGDYTGAIEDCLEAMRQDPTRAGEVKAEVLSAISAVLEESDE